jgi:hypothetical protein
MLVLSVTFRRGMFVVLSLALSAACRSSASPTPELPPVAGTAAAVVQGRVLDVDDRGPVAGAVIAIERVGVPGWFRDLHPQVITTADGNGEFALSADLPSNWGELSLKASRNGYEAASEVYIYRATGSVVLTLARTLTLVAGRPLEAHLGNSSSCGDEGESCRRIVVPSEAPIEVELTPLAGQRLVGLSLTSNYYSFGGTYQQRVTVSNGEVWIVGEPGPVRLTARKP